jgi:glycosyltransferase involved in cell wall biosynthesis
MRENIRIGFFEEWPSLRATKVMPYLTTRFRITYVTSEKGQMPQGDFERVIKYPAPRYINQRGIAFSNLAKKLYDKGEIDFAVHYAGIAFVARNVPIINMLGGSYCTDFLSKWRSSSWLQKAKLSVGFLHYTLPEYMACKGADRIITNSESLKSEIAGYYNLGNKLCNVVYNGLDVDFVNLGQDKQMSSKSAIIYTGRLHDQKGILKLVRSFHDRKNIDAPFLIAGDGPDRDSIAAICQDDNRIRLLGHLSKDRLIQEMNETTMFVFPSFHEGCPNALLEAMASRHACLCYDIPPVRDVLDGAGILSEVGNPEALCDRIAELVMAPAEVNRLANQAVVKSGDFSWEKCAMQIEQILTRFHETLKSC